MVSVATCKILYPVLHLGIRRRCSIVKFLRKFILTKTALNRDLESIIFKAVLQRTKFYMALLLIHALRTGIACHHRKVWLFRCIWLPS